MDNNTNESNSQYIQNNTRYIIFSALALVIALGINDIFTDIFNKYSKKGQITSKIIYVIVVLILTIIIMLFFRPRDK